MSGPAIQTEMLSLGENKSDRCSSKKTPLGFAAHAMLHALGLRSDCSRHVRVLPSSSKVHSKASA